jgi:hypothetical protein
MIVYAQSNTKWVTMLFLVIVARKARGQKSNYPVVGSTPAAVAQYPKF